MRHVLISTALLVFASAATAETLTWTGAGDGQSFGQSANWSGTPTGGTINMNALVDDYVIDDPAATVGGSGGVVQLSWVSGSGSLTMSAGSLTGATGLRYTTLNMTGGVMTRQFFLEVTATVSGTAELRLNGGGDPLNFSTVAVNGTDAVVRFLNETPAAFLAEHASKFTFDGYPAIENATFTVESDGGAGCIVKSTGGNIPAQDLSWTGAGDGESFADSANWSGTPTGGTISISQLYDRFTISTGTVGGLNGVSPMTFVSNGELVMTGGVLVQGAGFGTQGITGGAVTMTGGTLHRQFLGGLGASISGTAGVVLAGGNDPLPNGTTVDLSGGDCSITFLNETAADFENEHLAKFTVDGETAVLGDNLQVAASGKTGCVVTVLLPTPCTGDLNDDGQVDAGDIGIFIAAWGTDDAAADFDGNGVVDGFDLAYILGHWGACP